MPARIVPGIVAAALVLGAAAAQEPPTEGMGEEPVEAVEDPETGREQIEVQDSAILPSAGDHDESEAPTMEVDCEAEPEACDGEELTTPADGPEQSGTEAAPADEVEAAPAADR